MIAQPFVMFSGSHLVTLLIIISIAFLLPAIIKNNTYTNKIAIAKIIGISAIAILLA